MTSDPVNSPPESARALAAAAAASHPDDERFRLVAEALRGYVFDVDLVTGVVLRTEGLRDVVGYHPDEAEPTSEWWTARVHPEDHGVQVSRVEDALADPACHVFEHEFRVRHRDGRWVRVHDRVRIVRDVSGRAVRLVGFASDVTASHEAELARRESETRLRLLFEQSPASIHVMDVAGRTVQVNPAFEQMWGVTAKDLEGYILWDDPQMESNGLRAYALRALAGEVVTIPAFTHDPNISVGQGAARTVEVTVYPVRDAAGAVQELVVLQSDVSERVRAEREIAAGKARLAHVLDITPTPLVEFDASGHVVYANAAAERVLGLPRGRLVEISIGADSWRATTLDGRPIARQDTPVSRALRGEEVHDEELVIRDAVTGQRRVFAVRATPLRDATGAIVGAIGAFDESTARRAAQEERERLLEAERVARAEADRKRRHADFLAEASRMLAASLDVAATLRALASAAVPVLADWCAVDMLTVPRLPTPPGEVPADWPPAVERVAIAHQDADKVRRATELTQQLPRDWSAAIGVARVLREGASEFHPAITDEMLVAAAKSPGHLALLRELGFTAYLCVPIIARGEVMGALTLCHSESGRHYDADDLVLAEDLARRAAAAVDNARLFREAIEANRAKAEFLAVMSHELRTPLNAILGYAGLLEAGVAGTLEEIQRDFVRRGADAARRLLTLVDDVLTFARLEAGRVALHPESVDLAGLVEDVLPLIAPQAAARGVALVVADAIPSGLAARADRERAAQVLLNLLSNAVKFTPAGGRVTVQAVADEERVSVAVRDTGPGIAPAELSRLFQPFVQLDAGRTRTTTGTGLGLAISRDLARAMEGDVLAESEPGLGSTFSLVLPRA